MSDQNKTNELIELINQNKSLIEIINFAIQNEISPINQDVNKKCFFNYFSSWSLENENLILIKKYLDKYKENFDVINYINKQGNYHLLEYYLIIDDIETSSILINKLKIKEDLFNYKFNYKNLEIYNQNEKITFKNINLNLIKHYDLIKNRNNLDFKNIYADIIEYMKKNPQKMKFSVENILEFLVLAYYQDVNIFDEIKNIFPKIKNKEDNYSHIINQLMLFSVVSFHNKIKNTGTKHLFINKNICQLLSENNSQYVDNYFNKNFKFNVLAKLRKLNKGNELNIKEEDINLINTKLVYYSIDSFSEDKKINNNLENYLNNNNKERILEEISCFELFLNKYNLNLNNVTYLKSVILNYKLKNNLNITNKQINKI